MILMKQPPDSTLVLYTHGCRFHILVGDKQFESWVLADEMPGCGKRTWFPKKSMVLAKTSSNVIHIPSRHLKGFGNSCCNLQYL